MARLPKHAPAPAPLHGAAMIRSLYAHLSEGLARLPRPSAGWLPRSAPAWLCQVIKAILRLLGAGGPAQAAAAPPTAKKASRRSGKAPAGPGTQGGDAGEGEVPAAFEPAPGGIAAAVPGGAGAPTGQKARRRRRKTSAGPGPQGGDVGEGPCTAASSSAPGGNDAEVLGGDGPPSAKKARRQLGKAPSGPGPQGGDVGEGPCSTASDSTPGGNDAASLGGAEAQKLEPAVKNSSDPGSKDPLQKQEEAEGSSSASPDYSAWKVFKRKGCRGGPMLGAETEIRKLPQAKRARKRWEIVKSRKRCRGGPNIDAQVKRCTHHKKEDYLPKDCPIMVTRLPEVKRCTLRKKEDYLPNDRPIMVTQQTEEKCCTYCKEDGHVAKDCPRTKASINLSTSCDPRGKGHCRKSKDGDEGNCNLKKQRLAEDEEAAERKAHQMYRDKLSSCKKNHILCLACHLQRNKEVPIKKAVEKMKEHFKSKHHSPPVPCETKGCLAMAETKHDIGLHQCICHRTKGG